MSDYISEDILVLIFKYLPVKTLLRFRCVCNCWKQLIDHSPTLVQQHLSVQKPRFIVDPPFRRYLVVDASLSRPLVNTLTKPIEGKPYVLVGTLHGVVCLCDYRSLVLWNPSLRKFGSLPLPSDFKWHIGALMQNCYGFWIDPSTKAFKAIVLQRRQPAVKCILYSSIRRGWTVVPTEKLAKWNPCKDGPPVMIGGMAHWGGFLETLDESDDFDYYHLDNRNYYHLDHQHKDRVILSFDFVQESFEIIGLPDLYNMYSAPCHWQGTLSIVCWDVMYTEFPRGCEVYSRQEGSWVKMVGFQVYEPITHVFWAMEDVEERKKTGKRRDIEEEGLGDLIGGSQPSVRILAMIIENSRTMYGELLLDGTETGRQTVWGGLMDSEIVTVAYDFVESLLFP